MVENGINIKAAATRDSVPKFCVMAIKLKFLELDKLEFENEKIAH